MGERVVINTGPLIALARGEALDVAGLLPVDFVCPVEVASELDAGALVGCPTPRPAWLRVVPLAAPVDPVALASLDLGEAAVIQLAKEQGVSWVCIDETKARHIAGSVGLRVTGTLGLLGRAKALGLIPAMRPFVERMVASGVWFHADLVRRVLEGEGEIAPEDA